MDGGGMTRRWHDGAVATRSGQPSDIDASLIASRHFGESVSSCVRFTTGLRHWVYDVHLESGLNVVVRLSHADNRSELAGGVLWSNRLTQVGVPVANVLAHDVVAEQPFMILERLPGSDLGNVFDDLTDDQIGSIGRAVADMHKRAATLPSATGYGYATDDSTQLHATWRSLLEGQVDRAHEWILAADVVSPAWSTNVRAALDRFPGLDDVEPSAFLHDATTKNVIVHDGAVSGLVDVDEMAFGDPLWAVALTRMSLLAAERPTMLADVQAEALGSTDNAKLDLYTSIFCLTFLGEIGQAFNKSEPPMVDQKHRHHLEALLDSML